MRIWLTTDTHFGHDKMMEYCGRPKGFEDKILKHFDLIGDNDLLIHLGDICIGSDTEWHKLLSMFRFKKWLLFGNHDRKSLSWYMTHGWDFAGREIKFKMFGEKILLSHIPVKDDGWYTVNIHGHFHNQGHRRDEPEMVEIKNDKHKLLAIENTGLKPILLETLLRA